MKPRLDTAAARWTSAWTRVYTAGLPAPAREERRAEIASDVWEELHSGEARPGRSVLVRSIVGVPSDVTWRMEQSASPSAVLQGLAALARPIERPAAWTMHRGLPGLTTTVAAGSVILGLLLLITLVGGDPATQSQRATGGAVLLILGAFMLAGSQALPEQPRIGAALIIAPTALMGLILWATFVAPVVAAVISVSVVGRARAIRKQRKGSVNQET